MSFPSAPAVFKVLQQQLEHFSAITKLRCSVSRAALHLNIPSGSHWDRLKLLLFWCASFGLIAADIKDAARLLRNRDLETPCYLLRASP